MRIVQVGSAALVAAAAAFGSTSAGADEIRITSRDCQRIVRHVADADVAYKPGVDVRGKPVAPADLSDSPKLKLPDVYTFDINIDMGRYLGRPEDQAAAASAATLAADAATAAATAATTAANDATSTAEAARDVADAKEADATAAATAAQAAQAAYEADPDNKVLRAAARAAAEAAEEAAVKAAVADASADAIEGLATMAESQATSSASATSAAGKATAAGLAAEASAAAAQLAKTAAGEATVGEDATITALRSAATTSGNSAETAGSKAASSVTANTALKAAYRKAGKYGNLDMKVGTVRYDINTRTLTFNGEPLSQADTHAIAEECARMQREAAGTGEKGKDEK